MTDLANLAARFSAEGGEQFVRTLDQVTDKSAKAERATDSLSASNARLAQAQKALVQAQLAGDAITAKMIRDAGGLEAAVRSLSAAQRQQEAATRSSTTAMDAHEAQVRQMQAAYASAAAGAGRLAEFQALYAKGAAETNRMHAAGARAARLQGHELVNLSRQFTDVGVSMAMGMPLYLVAIQQGTQIADVFGVASQRGVTFSAALKQIAAATTTLLARLAPVAIVVGAVAAGFGLLDRQLRKGYPKDITDGLGLTEAQLKRVEDRTVHFGDTVMATFTVIGRHIMAGPVGEGLRWLADFFGKVMDFIVKVAVNATALMVGTFTGAYEAIRATWKMLPAAMGDLAISTANGVISAIEAMINRAIDLINGLIGKANAATKAAGLDVQIGTMGHLNMGGIANPYAGAGARAGEAAADAFVQGFQRGAKGVIQGAASLAQEIGAETLARARRRALEDAGDAGKGRTPRAPRDQTDERQAQIDAMIAQAKMEELQAQLALTREVQDRAKIEKQIILAQLAVKQAQVDRQIASIADDKGLSDAKKAELTAQLDGLKWLNAWTGYLQQKAVDEQASAARSQERLAVETAQLQNKADVLNSEAELATNTFARGQIALEILKLETQIEKIKLQETINSATATNAEKEIARLRLETVDRLAANRAEAIRRESGLLAALEDTAGALGQFGQAFRSRDWGGLLSNLASVLNNLSGLLANTKIGGALGKIGSFLGPIGGIVSGVIGFFGGLFGGGGSSRKRQEEAQRLQEAAEKRAREARDLEIRAAELSGNVIAALTMRRNDELDAIDPANREALRRVHQLEDEAEALAKANEIAAQRNDLLAQLAEIEGRTAEAEALRRAQALRDLPTELHMLQSMIWLRQDEAAAAQKAAELERARLSLEADLLDALGRSSEALAIRRRLELAALEASLRPWQEAIHKAQDFAAAMARIAEVQSEAISLIDQQISASQSAADQARRAADAYRDAATSLQDAIRGLRTGDLSILAPGQRIGQARGALDQAFGLALGGDLKALGNLPGLAQGLLQSAMDSARTSLEYRRAFGRTTSMLQQASNAAGAHAGTMTYQEQLLDIQTGLLKEIREELLKPDPNTEVLARQEQLLSTIGSLLLAQTAKLVTINSTLTNQTGEVIRGHSIVSAQTGQIVAVQAVAGQTITDAVRQQTGQVVSGNVILSAQTGAVEQGVALQDAIRAITAIDTSYSAQMLQALANQGQAAPFGDLLTGNNKVVSILQQIRDLIANRPVGDIPVPAIPNSTPSTPQMSAWEQAKAAIVAGDAGALQRYLTVNPDVAARYASPTGNAGDFNRLPNESILAFAQRHALYAISIGEAGVNNRGRNLYAMGGYTGAGAMWEPAGIVHRGEVVWSQADVARSGGVAAVEAMRQGWAANDNSWAAVLDELRALRVEVARLREPAEKSARELSNISLFGLWARGQQPGTPVETEAA